MNIDITSALPDNPLVKPLPYTIVLCRPEGSWNIGSVCRAMKNMNCLDLRIVGNKNDYQEDHIRTLAIHAFDVWEQARFFEPTTKGFQEAVSDCTLVAGTTRRMGQKRKSWGMAPSQLAEFALRNSRSFTAVVFGNERTGLTEEEIDCCSVAVNIPSNSAFPSLNLSHAVQIITYSLYTHEIEKQRGYIPIPQKRIQKMVASIGENTDKLGLFQLSGRSKHDQFLESVFARASLSEGEAKRIEKLFHCMAFIKSRCDPDE